MLRGGWWRIVPAPAAALRFAGLRLHGLARLQRSGWVALAALLVVALQAGCITPRSVHAFHEGAAAEAAGDLATAEARYAEAATGQDRLIGAELARIALMARSADRKKDADALLTALRKKAPADPLVCAFAALYALREGDTKSAAERLASARSLRPTDPPEVVRAVRAAQLLRRRQRSTDRQFAGTLVE